LQTASKLVYTIPYPENETTTNIKKIADLSNWRARSQRKLRNWASQGWRNPTRCNSMQIFTDKLLYMFRESIAPIIRST